MIRWLVTAILILGVCSPAVAGSRQLVHNPAEFERAAADLKPGDTIVLANGVWRDFQILLHGNGEPANPIALTAETPGQVILSGRSNLRMAGEYLVVSDLIFRDGYSPTGEVVSFRRSRSERANHSRVTNVVIEAFNKPVRSDTDNWVALYGRENRFDHNHLVGKTNVGTTLVVIRDPQQGLENHHRIDHNFFGARPNLGSNGGETLRVGTSADSESSSFTTVEFNWFEHCDGEVEIISNKSGSNVYRGNVFFESRGALTLRHGDNALVEDNIFLGNGREHTGGIRVINRGHVIRNNYLEGLAGDGFASALSILYGVPNSPINRYVQVDGVTLDRNTIVNAASIFLGAGKSEERSARPINSRLTGTLIVNTDGRDPVRIEGDVTGISLSGNVQSPSADRLGRGVRAERNLTLSRGANDLLFADGLRDVGARRDLPVLRRADTGVSWFPKTDTHISFNSGRTIPVGPGEDTLTAALAAAASGDQLVLSPGLYTVNQVLSIDRVLSVKGPAAGGVKIVFNRPTLFEISRGGSLQMSNLSISGENAPDSTGNAVIRTREGSGVANYELFIEDCRFSDLDVNRAFDVFAAAKGTMADRVVLNRVEAVDVSGEVINADAESDDLGNYNIERLEIAGSTFRNVAGAAVNLYRGGTDESTFGPKLSISGTSFERVAGGVHHASIRLHGVQVVDIHDNSLVDSAGIRVVRTVGQPTVVLNRNSLVGTPESLPDLRPDGAAR